MCYCVRRVRGSIALACVIACMCCVDSVYATEQHEYEVIEDATGKFVQGITTQMVPAYEDADLASVCLDVVTENQYVRVLGYKGDFYRVRGRSHEVFLPKSSVLLGEDLKEYVENSGLFQLELLVVKDCTISGGDNAGAIGTVQAGSVLTGISRFGSVYKIEYGSESGYAYVPSDSVSAYYDVDFYQFSDVNVEEQLQRAEDLQELINEYSRMIDEQQKLLMERADAARRSGESGNESMDSTVSYDAEVLRVLLETDLSETTALRRSIVEYAMQFVGNPYVWGGTSLTNGTDCSGFCQSVLRNFGISISRVSYEQCYDGRAVNLDEVQPGDLMFYRHGDRIGHVVMYAGGGKVVQAKGKEYGICITDVSTNGLVCIRNVID